MGHTVHILEGTIKEVWGFKIFFVESTPKVSLFLQVAYVFGYNLLIYLRLKVSLRTESTQQKQTM